MKNTLKHPRDYRAKRLALALQLCSIFAACATYAGVNVKWTAETSRVHPEIVEAWRGDTLDLACTLKSYGQPVSLGAATASFMWQTNGMGNAWWQTNATVSAGGVIRATWFPAMDPGAGEVAFFMPVQSAGGASYRAAGRIRFRPSPGAGSQTIDLPQPGGTLDFTAYQLVNAPWSTLAAVNSAIDANNALIDSAISSATGALVIPPAVDLGPYATTGMVFAAVQTSSNGLANAIQVAFTVASNRTDAVAAVLAAEISSTSNGLRSVLRDTIAESTTASRAYSDAVASNAQRAAIAAIPSLTGYATEQYVGDAIAAIELPSLDGYATTAYAAAAASNAQAAAIAAIPSLTGYATEQYVENYFDTNYTPPDLSSYASRSYADAAASNAQAAAIAAIPSLTGYATEQYVEDFFAANYTPPDLSSYASRSYADSAASNAQAAAIAAIPSLAGYATEQYVEDFFATNYTPPDLSSYASRSYADSAASNAQAAAIAAIPSLTGYATEQYVGDYFATNYTPPDLSSYASRSYADAAASNAQAAAMAAIPSLAGYATENYAQNAAASAAAAALNAAQSYARDLSWAASEGNTRLVSPDGTIWQDATGTVWQVTNVYGWAGTVIDLASSTARPIVFTFYGATTNAPNTGGVETDYWSAGGGTNLFFDAEMADRWTIWWVNGYDGSGPDENFHADGDPPPPATATNLTFTTLIEFYSLSYQPVALATNPVDRVLYESSGGGGGGGGEPGNYAAVSNAAMSAAAQTNDFLRLTGGSMHGPIVFPYFEDYGASISPWHPGALSFDSTYPDYSGISAHLDLSRIPTDANGNGTDEIAFLSDLPVPSAPEVTTALRWRADGTACVVTVAAGGTLTADTSEWTEGQAVMAIITLADGAGVASGIELVGYGAWPTGTPFVACCYRIGLTVFVVPSTTL